MSKILANQIANYGDDAPIEIKEGLNIPTGKPIQAAGSAGTNGQVLTSTGTSIQWTTPFNGDYNALANLPTIPAAQVASDWNATSGVSRILNKPVVPAQPSVVTASASGGGALAYNSGNGQFTYTPADLTGVGTDTLATVTARGAATGDNCTFNGGMTVSGNVNSNSGHLYFNNSTTEQHIGWVQREGVIRQYTSRLRIMGGNPYEEMAVFNVDGSVELYYDADKKFETTTEGVTITGSAGNNNLQVDGAALVIGGLTAGGLSYPETTGTLGQVLTSDGAGNVIWGSSSGGAGIALTDLSVTTTAAGNAALTYNNLTGVFTYTPPNLSGYLTSYTETDPVFSISPAAGITSGKITNWDTAYAWGDHTTAGYLTSLGDAAGVTTAKITEWDTAYSWGDHSTQGYLTTVALNDISDVTITTPSNGEVLTYNGAGWVNTAPTGGANVTISDTAPSSPTAGDLWWESDRGRLKIYYQDVDSQQWVDASPPLAQPNVPVAAGYINMNGNSPTWTGTTGYTVAKSGGDGTALGGDVFYTLTFPTAYSARTDYIVQASYDGTDWVSANGAQIGIERNAGNVVFCVRRWNEDPLNLGDIMVTITNL